jgi:hypothetical protein
MFLVVIEYKEQIQEPLCLGYHDIIDAQNYYQAMLKFIYEHDNKTKIEAVNFLELHTRPCEVVGEYTTVEYDNDGLYLLTCDGEGSEEIDLYK